GEPERCDGLDNDCNGIVDDGATCSGNDLCVDGECVPPCTLGQEFGCTDDTVCDQQAGICRDLRCRDVTCPPDQVCRGGACHAAQYCDGGACKDACTGAVCPPKHACVTGQCVPATAPQSGGGSDGNGGGSGGGGNGATSGGGCGCASPARPAHGASTAALF